ncbi:glycerol uptake facilitator protein [Virgisporangium aliadipatigenens]|uniref:Glycerol uptake facilitator protein n=1 Tax=Virgisporangium aliadipatigenens TaxID=741659 RepID=A0A8J3YJ05_9ACTN|nr:glycerol uptake facilitator protein [Virgisporangium aliadipatigenens]
MRRYAAEFVGTFFLIFTIGITVTSANALAPIAIGVVLMAMVYAGGHVSGAHFNPAVTVAALVRGAVSPGTAAGYVVVQVLGGVVAAGTARLVLRGAKPEALTFTGREFAVAFAAEALFTFALAYVVLNVATSRSHPDNSFYGLAIGGTVLAGAVTVGGISGGAFNPAVAIGAAAMGLISWSVIWVHLLAEILAGALAGAVFLALNPAERSPSAVAGGISDVEPSRVSLADSATA